MDGPCFELTLLSWASVTQTHTSELCISVESLARLGLGLLAAQPIVMNMRTATRDSGMAQRRARVKRPSRAGGDVWVLAVASPSPPWAA